jgi:hypothetical protein
MEPWANPRTLAISKRKMVRIRITCFTDVPISIIGQI